ncbi:hypothetical protein KCU83_g82, partial [Aureobasidium melanogenum]
MKLLVQFVAVARPEPMLLTERLNNSLCCHGTQPKPLAYAATSVNTKLETEMDSDVPIGEVNPTKANMSLKSCCNSQGTSVGRYGDELLEHASTGAELFFFDFMLHLGNNVMAVIMTESSKDSSGFVVSALQHQPAGRLGHTNEQSGLDQSRNTSKADGPAPASHDCPAGNVGYNLTSCDEQTLDRYEFASCTYSSANNRSSKYHSPHSTSSRNHRATTDNIRKVSCQRQVERVLSKNQTIRLLLGDFGKCSGVVVALVDYQWLLRFIANTHVLEF